MRKVFVFTGPTLRPEEARAELDAVYLPPVQQGDVYRAARENPVAIGIIDGFFEHVPAVWHKEILWAMAEGIHVFGASSMGALRAAELEPFGMEGVGEIFSAYLRGEFQDDDDVAVAHAGAEDDWRPLSEAMVNISATLSSAWLSQVVTEDTRSTLERVAKSLFYVERAWPVILARGAREGVLPSQLKALEAWLPTGRVDQKKTDALALLRTLRERLAVGIFPKTVSFPFQHTDAWEEARRRAGRLPLHRNAKPLEGVAPESLLDELRLRGALGTARRASMARALAVEEARRLRREPGEEELRSTAEALLQERGLAPDAFERWQAEQQVEDLGRLLRDESHVRWVETLFEPDVLRHLADHLRLTGEYSDLLERARDKERVLSAAGMSTPRLEDVGITEDSLWRWYFEERQGRQKPESLARAASDGGFPDVDSMRRAALRELCYVLAKADARD
ncbi:hypothetical protein JY651_02925 [Pyxidicoccus parkwayensis]|uniref:TfuA-like core domain-containing protein n=1 Tax=Pyxidicoccus parkwayensis TaxID=2813578 RepID=A0ABX7NZQ5_9BACT|nr:TfuA-like protein [Pyxidicoccus parkwaysis]QSQ23953.1 hypothetical protein JY651_02925 [Pyxidicoccus parkwaysis]